MSTIVKTRNNAIAQARIELKEALGVKRITAQITSSSARCHCGETEAVALTGFAKGHIATVVVGYCRNCAHD